MTKKKPANKSTGATPAQRSQEANWTKGIRLPRDLPVQCHELTITSTREGIRVAVQEDGKSTVTMEFPKKGGRRVTIQKPLLDPVK